MRIFIEVIAAAALLLLIPLSARAQEQCQPVFIVSQVLNASNIPHEHLTAGGLARVLQVIDGHESLNTGIIGVTEDGQLFVLLGKNGIICHRVTINPDSASHFLRVIYGVRL